MKAVCYIKGAIVMPDSGKAEDIYRVLKDRTVDESYRKAYSTNGCLLVSKDGKIWRVALAVEDKQGLLYNASSIAAGLDKFEVETIPDFSY